MILIAVNNFKNFFFFRLNDFLFKEQIYTHKSGDKIYITKITSNNKCKKKREGKIYQLSLSFFLDSFMDLSILDNISFDHKSCYNIKDELYEYILK